MDYEEVYKSLMSLGFWTEENKKGMMMHIEKLFQDYITEKHEITDIIINKDNVLLKWNKRPI